MKMVTVELISTTKSIAQLLSNVALGINLDNIKEKPILVIGFSGSGKSTIGKKLADYYNRPLVNLDEVWYDLNSGKDFKGFMEDDEKIFQIIKNLINLNKEVVVEGIHILGLYNNDLQFSKKILNLPLVILKTSALQSSFRALKRDKEFSIPFILDKIKLNFKILYPSYQNIINTLKTMKLISRTNNYSGDTSDENIKSTISIKSNTRCRRRISLN